MRLKATRYISDGVPNGAVFEIPDSDGRILLELGHAVEAEDTNRPVHVETKGQEPATAKDHETPAVPARTPAPKGRNYRVREIKAEGLSTDPAAETETETTSTH